jgi:hypothetical protein
MSDDDVGYIQNKGWDSQASMLESYRNLEKMRGVPEDRLLTLPGDPNNAEEMSAFYAKLGRPEDAAGYGAGEDAAWATQAAFDAGLTPAQFESMQSALQSRLESASQERAQQSQVESQNALNELQRELGSAYDSQLAAAKQAVTKFGVEAEKLQALEQAWGTADTMRFFMDLGTKTGEATFVGSKGDGSNAVVMTPAAAQAKITELRGDPEFIARYTSNDPQVSGPARKQMEDLGRMTVTG